MRIGCLQFAPQVGDIDNNLNRADAVLNRCQDLDDLDLLVLPELAFTGYTFHSLEHITPYLEPSGSGISALWARTTALKLNCNVVVGYPEKVDGATAEFFNSAIMVNRNGETIANYRKSFLYTVDEAWASEGREGFLDAEIPDLGKVAMGICMDINPYKFEAPWHAFEFAFHVLEARANLVILTMAWLTRESTPAFTQLSQEPDLETLEYWVQRLEPIIRSGNQEEIIFVVCNRTGIEENNMYAGTSSVFGVKDGEVNLYGFLGRGVKQVLVVDTDNKPFAKIVKDASSETVGANNEQQPPPAQQRSPKRNTESMPSVPQPSTRPPAKESSQKEIRRPCPDSSKPKGAQTSLVCKPKPAAQAQPSKSSPPKLGLQIPDDGQALHDGQTPITAFKLDADEDGRLPPADSRLTAPLPEASSRVPSKHTAVPSYMSGTHGMNPQCRRQNRLDSPITPPVRSWTRAMDRGPHVLRGELPSPPDSKDPKVRGCDAAGAVPGIPGLHTPPTPSGLAETGTVSEKKQGGSSRVTVEEVEGGQKEPFWWESRLPQLSNVVEDGGR